MGSLKKFDGSSWINSNLRKLTTDTDTSTTFPAIIYAEGTNATVGLKGNTVQNGTPTPDNPVMPQGTGDLETVGTKAGQYKIPISSANTTTPVYLGEVETTRRIAKIDLGTLDWSKTSGGNFSSNSTIDGMKNIPNYQLGNALSDMFTETTGNLVSNTPYSFSSCLNNQQKPYINGAGFEGLTAAEFKQAMSGVYMYYVLATEETGIVNEPLMRIGEYTDTLSGISIPVTAGGDTLSVGTTVQPSEVTANYYGWHTITVHERESGQWD